MSFIQFDMFYVFGAGSTALKCKVLLESKNKKIVSFLTSQGTNKTLDNIPVINLTSINHEIDKSIPVIIGVFNGDKNASMDFILNYLQEKGFENVINVYEFFDELSTDSEFLYWLTNRKYYESNFLKLKLVNELFIEEESSKLFDSILCFLETFNLKHLPKPNPLDQYFPKNVEVWNGNGTFLDIGSFNGQTVIDAYNHYGKLDSVIAYEPDPSNIKLINSNIGLLDLANQFILIPCGVWSKTVTLKFSSGSGESSLIKDEGNISIQCLSLDETLLSVVPGYIKMDIEGAEYEALIGGADLIRRFRPSLAICLYHHPSHFFEIPLLIKSWNLDYNFYIRSHGSNLFETVLYCTPKSK